MHGTILFMGIINEKDLDGLSADELRALLLASNKQLVELHNKQQEIPKLKSLVSDYQKQIKYQEKTILEKETELSNKSQTITAKEKLIRDIELDIQKKNAEISNKEQDILKKEVEIKFKSNYITQLKQEIAILRRFRFGKKSEQIPSTQLSLLDEAVDEDIAAIEEELEILAPTPAKEKTKQKPKRAALPAELPRIEIRHEPHSDTCSCGCTMQRIGEDISEKLDYVPGVARVERHIRGKWVCRSCETLVQKPVPAHVIDKGIATTGLLAHVLVAKYSDHLPLYRQEKIFERAGVKIPRSTLAQWVGVCGVRLQPIVDALRTYMLRHDVLHADETPVTMLRPDTGKTTHKAYLWAYATTAYEDKKAVIYEFKANRSGQNARDFLGEFGGKLVVDDYVGYKKTFTEKNVTEIACWAHARRKFYDLHCVNQSPIAKQALDYIGHLYEIEREGSTLDKQKRWQLRQTRAKPLIEKYHQWLQSQRILASNGSGLAKAIDYSLKRWDALVRYLEDGAVPIDNNHIEQQIRPIAVGKKNWLFAGSLRAGERAAAVMTLIQSAKINDHDPYAYMKDILDRLPTHPYSKIDELLPHNWQPQDN